MHNIIDINYHQTGESTQQNNMGMREMQAKAYEKRDAQYLLLKAPPASGKSRALMYIALDKLANQGIKKVIVAVPERSIGSSFDNTDLMSNGFYANWQVKDKYNLCTSGSDASSSKVKSFIDFLANNENILVCTHSTLRYAFEQIETNQLNNTLIAIDEFHHISADTNSRLGELLRATMANTNAHIVAMTGSYFRGDSVPILLPADEDKFEKVTYNYYDQLNGYTYLKSLGIGYHFYQDKYTSAFSELLNTDKKTILHIPNVNSRASTGEKYDEVNTIIDSIGEVVEQNRTTGVMMVKRHTDGKVIKVADLVEDDLNQRNKIQEYLRQIKTADDMDLIIALNTAKEGFDWPFCEHTLTVGYRGSLTEIIQIIGRCTRDSEGKTKAQFTNLIAKPDTSQQTVVEATNDMLKAITASLLMEQVLAPNFKFKARSFDDEKTDGGTILIKGFKKPSTKKVEKIINTDLNDLKAKILQDDTIRKSTVGGIDPQFVTTTLIPKIIKQSYPDLTDEEVEEVRQQIVADGLLRNAVIKEEGGKQFIQLADKFINIQDLSIDLIDSINPFQKAYEILSKQVTPQVLKSIQESIEATRIKMDFEEATFLWPKIQDFVKEYNRQPNINANDHEEKRMAQAIIYLKNQKRKMSNDDKGTTT
jgi:superfamily II DNA or RNA helicase